MSFGSKIRALREELSLTQKELGDKLNISARVIGYYESGDRFPKDEEKLNEIADFFNVSVDYLIGRTEQKLYPIEHTAFHTTSVDGLDEADIAIVESLIKQLKEKHKK